MISPSILAAALLAASPLSSSQDVQPQQTPEASATQLDDVVVEAQRTRDAAETFVRSIAAPVPGRKAALWRHPVCVGVGGMQQEVQQALADRISDWATSFGLTVMAPGCQPNIFVIATDDGNLTAHRLVESRPRQFHIGAAGTDQGTAALTRFQTSGAPVRWWHVSLPVSEDTGLPMVRLPGQRPFVAPSMITKPSDLGSFGISNMGSRLSDFSQDDLHQVIVVLDIEAFDEANLNQVADYIAMVALAQITPDATPSSPSILSLFDGAAAPEPTLTSWDRAYLDALYGTRQGRRGTTSALATLASALAQGMLGDPGPNDED